MMTPPHGPFSKNGACNSLRYGRGGVWSLCLVCCSHLLVAGSLVELRCNLVICLSPRSSAAGAASQRSPAPAARTPRRGYSGLTPPRPACRSSKHDRAWPQCRRRSWLSGSRRRGLHGSLRYFCPRVAHHDLLPSPDSATCLHRCS